MQNELALFPSEEGASLEMDYLMSFTLSHRPYPCQKVKIVLFDILKFFFLNSQSVAVTGSNQSRLSRHLASETSGEGSSRMRVALENKLFTIFMHYVSLSNDMKLQGELYYLSLDVLTL